MKTDKAHCCVAVDKDGTEKVSNGLMIRRVGIKSVLWGLTNVFYPKNERHKWANAWSCDDNDAMPFTGVILPKGSIEKLIGRKMTWKDEPVELLTN